MQPAPENALGARAGRQTAGNALTAGPIIAVTLLDVEARAGIVLRGGVPVISAGSTATTSNRTAETRGTYLKFDAIIDGWVKGTNSSGNCRPTRPGPGP